MNKYKQKKTYTKQKAFLIFFLVTVKRGDFGQQGHYGNPKGKKRYNLLQTLLPINFSKNILVCFLKAIYKYHTQLRDVSGS